MTLPRDLEPAFRRARSQFPALLLTGPRQAGKTTFLRDQAPDAGYVSLDDPLQRAFARDDPNGLLDRFPGPVVLDEVQHAPELLPYLKLRIDRDRRPGRFLLTGSQQFELMRGVSESLAGRVAILELLPFSLHEHRPATLADAVWIGGYPEPALRPELRDLWVSSYLRTYVERDVRMLRNIGDLRAFERFLALIAAHHGQELRAAPLARDVGVSQPTIGAWVTALTATYVASTLEPWHRNLGKRVVRSPKVYLVDPALACALTRQPTGEAALAGPLGGALFEGLVVGEARKAFVHAGRAPACWFWRSHDGLEVDLLLELAGRVVPVEIKLTATPTPRHVEPLARLRALIGPTADPGLLVCQVPEPTPLPGGATALPWQDWPAWLAARIDPPGAPAT